MKVLRRITRLAGVAVIVGGLANVTFTPCLALSQSASTSLAAPDADTQPSFPPAVRDVLKMLDAKVDPGVVKTYIQNSTILFNPTANQIIALKQHGVPDDLIAAMIQRGAEVRMQMAQAAQAAQEAAVQAPNAPPGYDYGTTAPYDYSDYGFPYYGSYGYPYGYPYWWSAYGYPWGYYSPFFFGFRSPFFFRRGFNRFPFGGKGSFAFRPGFGNRAPWSPAIRPGFRPSFGRPAVTGRSFAFGGARVGGFGGARMGGFAGRGGGGFGGHGGGGHR